MTRRGKIWLAVATLFSAGNLVGAGFAVSMGEQLHAMTHVALAFLGALVAWQLVARSRPSGVDRAPAVDARLENLQNAVDAVAIEVERIGEAQRFSAQLRAERVDAKR